jgi:hypothetical protein
VLDALGSCLQELIDVFSARKDAIFIT